jgi:hypothetical protein
VVPSGDWLVSNTWFLLSTGQVAIGIWGNSLPVVQRKVLRTVLVFARWQLCCPTAATLSSRLLPQQGGEEF